MRKHSKQVRIRQHRPAKAALAVAVCLAISSVAAAQDAPADQQKKEEKTAAIGTVTVTAQKREENLQKVPISINVLGTQTLEQHNVNSFEDAVSVVGLHAPVTGVFIRAPIVTRSGPSVEILSRYCDKVVAVRQGNLLGTAFHPELTDDTRLHEWFLSWESQ